MPRMRGSAISGKPFRRGSLDLDTKAPLKRIRSSVNLWFDKVFGDVHLSPCPLEQVLGEGQATPLSGDVLPLSAEKRPWRCPATLRSGDVLPLSEAEMQQRQQHNGNSHGISDSNNDSNTSRRQRQQQP